MSSSDRNPSSDLNRPGEASPAGQDRPVPIVLDAQTLFQGQREIWIELAGIRYRLRLTRRNKLILQK